MKLKRKHKKVTNKYIKRIKNDHNEFFSVESLSASIIFEVNLADDHDIGNGLELFDEIGVTTIEGEVGQKSDVILAIKSEDDDDDYGGQNVAVTGCKTSQPSCSPRGQMWGGELAEDLEAPSRSKIVFGNPRFELGNFVFTKGK
jgi:hypothetical protein